MNELECRPDQLVARVLSVTVTKLEGNFSMLMISAVGLVPSGGWTMRLLRPKGTEKGGIWDFDFIAGPPQSIANPIAQPIGGMTLVPLVSGAKIVRVRAHQNFVDTEIGTAATVMT